MVIAMTYTLYKVFGEPLTGIKSLVMLFYVDVFHLKKSLLVSRRSGSVAKLIQRVHFLYFTVHILYKDG